jgi:glycosyltransferase involved in cell wall biosynthesis
MNVVVLDADVSYPPTSGKRLRSLNLILPLARRHNIVYLGRLIGEHASHPEAEVYFRDHGIEPIFVHHPLPKKSGPLLYARLAANLFDSKPYSVATHLSPKLKQAAKRLAAERSIDLWQLEWPMLLPLVDRQPNVPRIAVAHNVESLIWRRYVETTTNVFKKAFLENQRRKFEDVERRSLCAADRVVAVSEEDAALIRGNFGQPRVDVVDNGVDPEYYARVAGERDRETILFLGALDWRPNQDALDLLLNRVFPEVRRQVPAAKLLIVGRNPAAALAAKAKSTAGAELHANVPDVRPFLGRANVMAVPLRIGGGSRLKILEALAAGLPVVSSPVGAEGLRLVPDQHFVEADIGAMADALVAALRHPEAMLAMAERGRIAVREQYDWTMLAAKLEQTWETARANVLPALAMGAR